MSREGSGAPSPTSASSLAGQLRARLQHQIRATGPLRFDRYMERALFEPGLGYYSSGRARIGKHGDFYTNVSVGRTFGRLLSSQFAEIFHSLGAPAPFTIVEQGANTGAFASDVLSAFRESFPAIYAAAEYRLVEPFPSLRSAQEAALSAHAGKVSWTGTIAEVPPFTGIHFTNEYADALPVRLLVKSGGRWRERHVGLDGDALAYSDLPLDNYPPGLPDGLPDGYLAEFRPAAAQWISDVSSRLVRGCLLTIDYGFPRDLLLAPWRTRGTLSCYRAHRRDEDPLAAPGEKDITAHVDFTALAEAGRSAGLELAGFTDQYHFLAAFLDELPPSDPAALKTLLHPELMGTQFKYLALARGIDRPLSGFRFARPAASTLGI